MNESRPEVRTAEDLGEVEENERLRPPVSLVEASLYQVHFERLAAGRPDPGEPIPLLYGLGAAWITERRVGVEFSIEFKEWKWAKLYVSYRALFEVPGHVPEERLEETMKRTAAGLGPIVMYPYIRQEIDGILSRANLGRHTLPVLNVGAMFEADTIELKPPQHDLDLEDEP